MLRDEKEKSVRFYLEIIGGILLIVFGILFFIYLGLSFQEVTTDVIFVGAGVLIIRRAIQDRKQDKVQEQVKKKNQKGNPATKAGQKKTR